MLNLKADIYALLKASIGSETLVEMDQNAPRPALPYWAWRLQTVARVGMDHHSQEVTDDGDETLSGVREGTINVQRYGANSEIAVSILRDDLQRTTVHDAWLLKDLAIYDTGPATSVPTKLDNAQYEARASLDVFVRFGTSLLDRVGIVETTQIEAQYPQEISAEIIDNIVVTNAG